MYITVAMFIFTLCVNFVSASGIFPVKVESGFDINESNRTETLYLISGQNITDLWGWAAGLVIVGAIIVGWLTKSTAILGVYIFSVTFWTSYVTMLGITDIGNYVPPDIIFIGSAGLMFIWVGAIIGMLSGSG